MLRGKRIGLVTILALCLAVTACSGGAGSAGTNQPDSAGPITFAAPDPHGGMAKLVEQWNAQHPGEPVQLKRLAADETAQHEDLLQSLAKPDPGLDVLELKTSDTAEFAAQGWLQPLSGRYAIDSAPLVAAAVAAGRYQNQLYSAPLDLDVGLLYYRSDLLGTPPASWAQLAADCATARRLSIGCYAGQYAKGDDLAANTIEAVTSAGGQLLQPDGKAADLDSTGVRNGLRFLADSYRDGVIPKAAVTYQASQSSEAFGSGSLLFMRNWASAYPAVAGSAMKARFKLAPLPGAAGPGTPALAGHSLAIGASARHRTTALAFVKFLETPASQRARLASDNAGPVTSASYRDPALGERYPVLAMLQRSLPAAQAVPVSEFYPSISDAISDSGYAAITGQESVASAISQLRQAIAAAAR